jgi:ferredoxin-NADP reductase/MOSC domain-containing protein YiiM/ferredoxin
MARLLSVNVGLPRDVTWRGRTVHTSIWKQPVQGRRMARRLNLDGDGQGDLAGHGGEQRAIFVYQMDSYHYWAGRLGRSNFSYGQFSENFTVEGLSDDDVCIGDRYRVGGALLEVSQPRVTCYRIGIRMDEPRMAALLTSSGRPGFYFRVLEEGEVGAGDEIVKTADGPERMTVAAVNALLYLPGHAAGQLERALRIPALSPGWRTSFLSLLQQDRSGRPVTGNPGLAPAAGPPPEWTGFRRMRVTGKRKESGSVVSFDLEATDERPLVVPLPGQFVVLRLQPDPAAAPLLRSYSLSGAPSGERYRVSVKLEPHGAAGTYLDARIGAGDEVDVSAPRGSFTLQPGKGPVVLLSAGIGATPVMAMLHALTAERSSREVWWLFGARNRAEHPFARESRDLVEGLSHGRYHLRYSRPRPDDRPGLDYDAPGRLSVAVLEGLGVPREADFYLCGPPAFLEDLTQGLESWGIAPGHIHTEIFGPGRSLTPGIVGEAYPPPHQPPGPPRSGSRVSFARSGVTTGWGTGFENLLELAEACDVPVRWSCRTGVCHSCESGLIAGAVSYDPIPLEPPADGSLLICCARPRGDVIIDL